MQLAATTQDSAAAEPSAEPSDCIDPAGSPLTVGTMDPVVESTAEIPSVDLEMQLAPKQNQVAAESAAESMDPASLDADLQLAAMDYPAPNGLSGSSPEGSAVPQVHLHNPVLD